MKTRVVLAGALGLCAAGCVGLQPSQPSRAVPYAEIHQRATNVFASAEFFKPVETRTNTLGFTLAPLILQQVNEAGEPPSLPDRFGALITSNGAPVLDQLHPTIYWEADTARIQGNAHARFAYLWCYPSGPYESERGQGTNNVASGQAGPRLPLQGIRITLNSAGQPAIWEVLADNSGAKVLFVSQHLEAAAMAEFGKPLPGRRYAIERGVEAAPDVIVARVIDDSPVVMGPIVYLSAGTRAVSTLICRCMPAQARKLVSTSTYDLQPWRSVAASSLVRQAGALAKERAAFWPGEEQREWRVEGCLRLPRTF